MYRVPFIETARLLLRPWREDDLTPFAEINSDPEVMKHFPALMTEQQSHALVSRIKDDWQCGSGLWAVEVRESKEFIGYIGFSQPKWEASFTPCIEIGWRLSSSSWGQGFATEGAQGALHWSKQNVAFPRNEVLSFTSIMNHRSRRVMEKLGMTHNEKDDFDHPLFPQWSGRRHVLYRMPIS